MALTVTSLVVPSSNGVGLAADIHLLDAQKSFALDGTLGPNEQLVVEVTEDPSGIVGFTGLLYWDAGNVRNVTIPVVAAFARIRRFGASAIPPFSSPSASVSATSTGTNSFFSLPVPTSGVGASVDVSSGGQSTSFSFEGNPGPIGAIVVEGSNDNVSFIGIVGFTSKAPPGFYPLSYKYLRIRRLTSTGAPMTFFVGTTVINTGGGGNNVMPIAGSVAFDSTVMSGTNQCVGLGINVINHTLGSFQPMWTGTPVGNANQSFLFDGSDDATDDPASVTNWTALTTPAAFSSAAAIPAGGPGSFVSEWFPLTTKWIRIRYLNGGAGAGVLACQYVIKA